MNPPSTPDAKLQHPAKCLKANIHSAFCHVHPIKSPTRLPEDPHFFSVSYIGFMSAGFSIRLSSSRCRATLASFWMGNRRHARKRGLSDPCEIYQRGAEKLDDILDWCAELCIPAVTLWVFSTENLKRSRAEVSGILSAIETKVAALAHDPFLHQERIHIQAIGRLDLLPESVVAAIRAAERATAQYNSMTLTIAVGYGGREEIADAVRDFVRSQAQQGASLSDVIERITPEAIACHLYAANLPDPDLIIRTSGEIRLSGFLLWQSVHSEFYFTDALWPALRKVDFLRAIRAYQARNRRFGR